MATNLRTALALTGMLVWLGSAQAEELNFSDLESRLAKIESQLASQNGIQQAGYSCGESCCTDAGCGDACCGDSCGCGACGCGGCGGCGCGSNACCNAYGCNGCGGWYSEAHLVFARAHVNEGAVGKLSEEYELAPRFILGYENGCGQGGRVRYWHYGHHSDILDDVGGIRFEWDVIDFELTNRWQGCRTDVTFAGGARLANIEIEAEGASIENDLIGLTAAVDAETLLCCDACDYWSWVYGSRLAILGGDWEGTSGDLAATLRDDNVIVYELYVGVEYGCCYCGYDLYSRLAFEMQNWHSDEIDFQAGTSIGFVGPAWHVGLGW
jgi:hypothetical protein